MSRIFRKATKECSMCAPYSVCSVRSPIDRFYIMCAVFTLRTMATHRQTHTHSCREIQYTLARLVDGEWMKKWMKEWRKEGTKERKSVWIRVCVYDCVSDKVEKKRWRCRQRQLKSESTEFTVVSAYLRVSVYTHVYMWLRECWWVGECTECVETGGYRSCAVSHVLACAHTRGYVSVRVCVYSYETSNVNRNKKKNNNINDDTRLRKYISSSSSTKYIRPAQFSVR